MIRKLFRSTIVKLDLYKNDLTVLNNFKESYVPPYQFIVISDSSNIDYFRSVREERGERFMKILLERLNSENFLCFSFMDGNNKDVAYLRWLRKETFYHETYKKEIKLEHDEAFTLDSYTSLKHRGRGLHKEMNKRMLNYCKNDLQLKAIYMVIFSGGAFFHLHKLVTEIGYKKYSSNIYLDLSYIKSKIQLLYARTMKAYV